jgi:DNA helicase II / ATP-dependent DNA helicase PcrA
MAELNEPQAHAVAHESGPLLIFAGAGSGKTRTITYRIANLLATHRVPPYRILAVTFTNKAAGEMRNRLVQLAGDDIVRDLWVGTFHSICAKLLRRYAADAGLSASFLIYDDADQKAVMNRLLKERGIDEKRYPAKFVLSKIHAEKREARHPDEASFDRGFDDTLKELYEGYERALGLANALDFEDLLLKAMRLAEADTIVGRSLRERFQHVLVDEFQDTNHVQYRLVRALSARARNLCVVGDDDQSIYRWRGADVRIIRGFQRDFADATVVKLEQNYRSTANIVRAALGVIEPALDREPKKLWTSEEPGAKVTVRFTRDERDEATWVAGGIAAARSAGVDLSELAVFYRVHAQSRVLEEALRARGLPYQIIGGMRFFDRAEVKDLLSYLRLLENPASDTDLLRIINVPTRGIGGKTVARILDVAQESTSSAYDALELCVRSAELGAGAKKKLAAFRDMLEELRALKSKVSLSELGNRILQHTGYREALRQEDSAEADARLGNLEELLGSMIEYEHDAEATGEEPTLSGYLERVSLVAAVDSMRDVPSVSLMTVHSAKGLEFDTVWLTGMEEEVFPYRGLSNDEPEELDEERRLAYVAITRARRKLNISYVGIRNLFGQTRYLAGSRFLADLPAEVVEREGQPQRPQFGSFALRGNPPRPAPRPGERFVDSSAFDDLRPDEDGDGIRLRPGDRVSHKQFGRGVVEQVESGQNPKVTARFPRFGTRQVLAAYLQPG